MVFSPFIYHADYLYAPYQLPEMKLTAAAYSVPIQLFILMALRGVSPGYSRTIHILYIPYFLD